MQPQPLENFVIVRLAGRSWRVNRFTYLLLLGLLVGIVTGGVTVAFRMAAMFGERMFLPSETASAGSHAWMLLRRLFMPAAGGLISGLILYKLARFSGSHSIPAILRAVASGQILLKARMAMPAALSVITMASGNSAGSEGPIAEIGSVMGSLSGRALHAPPRMIKTLIGAGVAAGIAAVFNAPMAGVFFSIEVILRNYEMTSFTPIVVAAVSASVIAETALGSQSAIALPVIRHISFMELPLFGALGIFCGAVSILYILGLSAIRKRFEARPWPLWLKPAMGGLGVGALGLWRPELMGEGYGWVREIVAHPPALTLLALLLFGKIVVTGFTLGSGNPGGTFAPAVFQGAVAGALFGKLMVMFNLAASPIPYAITGMAASIASSLGAPLTGLMIILAASSGNYADLLLPTMCSVALSAFVMQTWRGGSVYTHELLLGGVDLDRMRRESPYAQVPIEAIMQTDGFPALPIAMPAGQALERFKEESARWFVAQDEAGRFKGIVTLHELRLAIEDEALAELLTVEDVMEASPIRLTLAMNLLQVMKAFGKSELDVLPVFDGDGKRAKLAGVVTRQSMLNAYLEIN